MAQAEDYFQFFSRWIASDKPNSAGEYRMLCPVHNERTPSASINFSKGVFACMNPSCVGGMSLQQLKSHVLQRIDDDGEHAAYDPLVNSNVTDMRTRKRLLDTDTRDQVPLTEGKVRSWCRTLHEEEEALSRFKAKRALNDTTIKEYEIGYDLANSRYVIPVRDISGTLSNVRMYRPDAEVGAKMANWSGLGSPPRLYPIAVLADADEVLIVEGELDALIAIQNCFAAVSGTGGAGRWTIDWSRQFDGKKVSISYDNDLEGRVGAKKVAASVSKYAREVRVLPPLMDEHKSDITDFFQGGGTPEQLRLIIDSTDLWSGSTAGETTELGAVPTTIEVIGTMDATSNGKPLTMTVNVFGKKNPSYSFPRRTNVSCTMDAGPKCKLCPMLLTHEGDTTVELSERDVENFARLVDTPEERRIEVMRRIIGAKKCDRMKMKVTEPITVEELFISNSIEHRNTEASDFTQRRIYNIGAHETDTNTVANIVGTTWPSAKDGRNEFFSWNLEPAVTSIDAFEMTPEIAKQLAIFKPRRRQSPIDKAREIAEDLSVVTGIVGRERMQISMDLVWHSALRFRFGGKLLNRGWLEFIVVGDTRTGKSETAIRLADWYGVGHVIGCEGASFAGLVGGVKQVGNEWTITWGEIPVNDRRLVILDEFGGLSYDIIGQLSDIRTRGVAQITKVETSQTLARCRIIAISNPRKSKFVDEKKTDGIDIVEDVVGNEEDVARFDFAMSVSGSDVPSKLINRRPRLHEPSYTREACHNLILWAWSRKPADIHWEEGAEDKVYQAADWLGQRYVESPPLLQMQSAKDKIARMAVALAARTFSTDSTSTQIIVRKIHVTAAVNFLDRLYSYDNFGYRRLSERLIRNRAVARSQSNEIRKFLLENPLLLEFLLDKRGSFRAPDLEEMAFMMRDEVNIVLGRLSKAKMIKKSKSQIVMEPELTSLLKEIERGMH